MGQTVSNLVSRSGTQPSTTIPLTIRTNSTKPYSYPPSDGSPYFGPHFMMGGEKFDSIEAYLFGDNSDLNLLGPLPVPFPYQPVPPGQPLRMIQSLVHLRRDSVRLTKISDCDPNTPEQNSAVSLRRDHVKHAEPNIPLPGASEIFRPSTALPPKARSELSRNTNAPRRIKSAAHSIKARVTSSRSYDGRRKSDNSLSRHRIIDAENSGPAARYNLEFVFDSNARCAITVYYFATELISGDAVLFKSHPPELTSETVYYKRGANQVFTLSGHVIQPSMFSVSSWKFKVGKEHIPIVIHLVVDDPDIDAEHHSHVAYAGIIRHSDGTHVCKIYKQKQMIDGVCYLLQEIYGVENKALKDPDLDSDDGLDDDQIEDTGCECIVCMCEPRDTLILPCRHLCLCNSCADSLRYQASNCPICRAPFKALLQIRAMRRRLKCDSDLNFQSSTGISQEGVLPGYTAVPLIEALNGPISCRDANTVHLPPSTRGVSGVLSNAAQSGDIPSEDADDDSSHECQIEDLEDLSEDNDDSSTIADSQTAVCDGSGSTLGTIGPPRSSTSANDGEGAVCTELVNPSKRLPGSSSLNREFFVKSDTNHDDCEQALTVENLLTDDSSFESTDSRRPLARSASSSL